MFVSTYFTAGLSYVVRYNDVFVIAGFVIAGCHCNKKVFVLAYFENTALFVFYYYLKHNYKSDTNNYIFNYTNAYFSHQRYLQSYITLHYIYSQLDLFKGMVNNINPQ